MKKLILLLLIIAAPFISNACPVCERNKSGFLQGITHGSNPDSNWDYVIVIFMIAIAVVTLYYSVKMLVKPNEKDTAHIKYSFLNGQ